MATAREHVHDATGTLELVREVYRDAGGTARYREFDPPDLTTPTLDRPATPSETKRLVSVEERDNRDTLDQRASEALTQLRALRDTTGNLPRSQLSSAVRLLARVLIAVIRIMLRRLDGTD